MSIHCINWRVPARAPFRKAVNMGRTPGPKTGSVALALALLTFGLRLLSSFRASPSTIVQPSNQTLPRSHLLALTPKHMPFCYLGIRAVLPGLYAPCPTQNPGLIAPCGCLNRAESHNKITWQIAADWPQFQPIFGVRSIAVPI